MSGTNCHGPVARYKSPMIAHSGLAVPAFRIPLGTVGRGRGPGAGGGDGGDGGGGGGGGGGIDGGAVEGGGGGASTVGTGGSEVMLVGRLSIDSSSKSTGSSKLSLSPPSSLGAAAALCRRARSRMRSSDRVNHWWCLPVEKCVCGVKA